MTQELLDRFGKIKTWRRRRDDNRAPHKPLLALWAIGRCLRGQDRLAMYCLVEKDLFALLKAFGPPLKPGKRHRPNYPFWRMQNDHVWEVPEKEKVTKLLNGDASARELRELGITGGLPEPIFDLFRREPERAIEIADRLATAHFPETMQTAVLEATLGDDAVKRNQSELLQSLHCRRARNPRFRTTVLREYHYRCAVCEFSLEFPDGNWPALEAAHIKWHSHRGPDLARNGLSLCVLHHELFDWGAFTIQPKSLEIEVAGQVLQLKPTNGLTDFHGRKLAVRPKDDGNLPAAEFLVWHEQNVFRRQYR